MIQPRVHDVRITHDEEGFHVRPLWSAPNQVLDRPEGTGYLLTQRSVAFRLKQAMLDQMVFVDPSIKTDVDGRTYVSASSRVMGRMVNADLLRLGY